jgi:hypothetical protein
MKSKKNAIKQIQIYRLFSRFSIPLIIIHYLFFSAKVYGLAPDYAEVTKLEGEGIGINDKPAKIKDQLSKYRDNLAVPAPFSNEKIYANLDLIKKGVGKMWIQAKAWNGSTTYYWIPCTLHQPKYTEAEFTWSNGDKAVCGEGMLVTSNSRRHSSLPNHQTPLIAQADKMGKNKFFLTAQHKSDVRYYCSSVPNSGNGSGKIVAGLTSIEEACQQSQEVCESKNNGCSIATMGEWNLNDSDLTMTVTCSDGKSSSKRVSGSEINAPGSSFEDLVRKLSKDLGLDSLDSIITSFLGAKACYLEVYSPDEVLISPVNNQQTIVQTTGLEGNKIRVDVKEGQARLRSSSTKLSDGVIANQGDIYIFNGENGEGSIYLDRGRDNRSAPGSSTSPPSNPNSSSPDSPSSSSPSNPSSPFPDTSPSPSSTP